jgi:O-methyltransferase involved in polyketide biosynthesis
MSEEFPPILDLERPNAARVYDWLLGGTTHWAIDRVFGERAVHHLPIVKSLAKVNREFLGRTVRHCVRNGVTQFLDIGSGIPTVGNVHEIADSLDPRSRCVYVDYEHVAVSHARILLDRHGNPKRHTVVQARMQDVTEVWTKAVDSKVLDPTKPVALTMVALLHFIPDELGVHEAVAGYRELLPPGSRLVLSHVTEEGVPDDLRAQLAKVVDQYRESSTPCHFRDLDKIAAFFGDFDLIDPGLVWLPEWHLDKEKSPHTNADFRDEPNRACVVGGIGVKR